jgi:hypothetical protein
MFRFQADESVPGALQASAGFDSHRPLQILIWNDLSTRNSVLSFFFHSCSSQEAAQVAVGEATTTIDHSDIRGSDEARVASLAAIVLEVARVTPYGPRHFHTCRRETTIPREK